MISDLYFNAESHYSEENTSDNEDFHSTILQQFQFEFKQKKWVVMRAMRNYRSSRSQKFFKIGVLKHFGGYL